MTVGHLRYAYLHGFASSSGSRKGVALRARLEGTLDLELPDLNRPSFADLSHAAMIDYLAERYPEGETVRFIGSSLGGWCAARFAQLYPERIDKLVLLCPGFELASRWPSVFGAEMFERWQREGRYELPAGDGTMTALHYGFYEEACREVGTPEVSCPTHIVHGSRDEVVPISTSRKYANARAHVGLTEVDDDHYLADSVDVIESIVRAHFEV